MFKSLMASLFDLLIPPRRTERTVQALTIEDLQLLAHEDGLPYREKTIRDLVWEIKYYANAHAAKIAGEYLSDELLAIASEEIGTPLLIPVPMHPVRRRERGHNQTEVLCEAALPHLEGAYEYRKDILVRTTNTAHQQGLQRSKRLKNVENSMAASDITDRVCIVVDDVTTTGATLHEAKSALFQAGARRVHCVALARS